MCPTPHASPSNADAEEGEVVVDGPGAVAYSMTPEAALETSGRLQQASLDAQQQDAASGNEEGPSDR